jgi:preprotein translocase subunit Sss1
MNPVGLLIIGLAGLLIYMATKGTYKDVAAQFTTRKA